MKKKCKVLKVLFTLLTFSGIIFANEPINLGICSYLDGLKYGFNMTSYRQCITKMNQCPKNGPYLDYSCVQSKVDDGSSCKQLTIVAKHIQAAPEFIQAKSQAGFTIFDVSFPADNGHQFSLLSPKGCLLDTTIDPRDLNPILKEQYKKYDFYIEAHETPHYIQKHNTQQLTIELVIKNQCRACEKIGTAVIVFEFDHDGKWQKTKLLSFRKA